MSTKQFGVWMDLHHAIIVAKENESLDSIKIIAHVKGEDTTPNSSEKNANNQEKNVLAKFFKEITTHMQNATHIHITGTGVAQEKFKHYLADIPQFKNTKTEDSTSNKLSDDQLIDLMKKHLV